MKHRKVHSFEAMKTFTKNLDVKVSPPPPKRLMKKSKKLTKKPWINGSVNHGLSLKKGFISASKWKSCVTRRTTLDKSNETLVTSVAKSIVFDPPPTISKSLQENPQNPRDWGLKHEESARKAYMHVQNHVHYKVRL